MATHDEECSTDLNETKDCDVGVCPVDCQWSTWEGWSRCSRTCNGGINSRKRTEKVAAAHGGKACQGSADEDGVCNIQGCPVDCKWVPWSEWSPCSTSCGGGNRTEQNMKMYRLTIDIIYVYIRRSDTKLWSDISNVFWFDSAWERLAIF